MINAFGYYRSVGPKSIPLRCFRHVTKLNGHKDLRFAYDGWNLLGELTNSASTFTVVRSYAWGLDLSGSMQGAGGVGGLLVFAENSGATILDSHYAAFDGNGNVMALVSSADASQSARYEYGPFGEVLRATGPMAKANPFRFSTKYQDDETDLVYYGYRYFNASTGRWLSRDPAGEDTGELNLYGFVCNDPLGEQDGLGLMRWSEVEGYRKALDERLQKIKCCACDKSLKDLHLTFSITGTTSGTTVTGHANPDFAPDSKGCLTQVDYFWWTCYHAIQEGSDNSRNQGWRMGDVTFSDTEKPGFFSPISIWDPYHLAMDAVAIVHVCSGGNMHALTIGGANELVWTWNKKTKSWTGPVNATK